jgi:hypothetical protein
LPPTVNISAEKSRVNRSCVGNLVKELNNIPAGFALAPARILPHFRAKRRQEKL